MVPEELEGQRMDVQIEEERWGERDWREGSNDQVELSSPQGLLQNTRPMQPYAPNAHHFHHATVEIYANPPSKSGPSILNPSPAAVLVKTVDITRPCYLLLNHSGTSRINKDGRTKVVTTKQAMPRSNDKEKGYDVVVRVKVFQERDRERQKNSKADEGKFMIEEAKGEMGEKQPFDQNDIARNVFVSLRKENNPYKWYGLQHNDTLKFGREVYKFRIITADSPNTQNKYQPELHPTYRYPYPPRDLVTGNCRICLSHDQQEEDPIISPCSCSGSCGDVHLTCLRLWMESKLLIRSQLHIRTYNLQKFQCQVCKSKLPPVTYFNGTFLSLLPPSIHSNLTYQLQQITSFDSHLVHCIDLPFLSSMDFKIGRGVDNDIVLDDMSVSRMHATLRIIEGQVWLEDRNSKFGTFVHLRGSIIGTEAVLISHRVCFNFKSSKESLTDCDQ